MFVSTDGGIGFSDIISAKAVHPAKAESPILVTRAPSLTVLRLVDLLKADFPMFSSFEGEVNEVNPMQYSKADYSIEITEAGRITVSSERRLQKAILPIEVNLLNAFSLCISITGLSIFQILSDFPSSLSLYQLLGMSAAIKLIYKAKKVNKKDIFLIIK